VWEVAAVEGTRRGEPVVEPLFRFRYRRTASGCHEAVGTVPEMVAVLRDRGETLDDDLFAAGEEVA
jgi:hypothetical protein